MGSEFFFFVFHTNARSKTLFLRAIYKNPNIREETDISLEGRTREGSRLRGLIKKPRGKTKTQIFHSFERFVTAAYSTWNDEEAYGSAFHKLWIKQSNVIA
ncbi:uncharacterized protein LOC116845941 [Odontomachus brunneus]|uniref:uncharacterized protein LOC116845941 n=1 Tax=Odontomachus brunneus TaxID=486640 RepID=UPI0013F1CDE9|nr:uncharacterized protein LOC116845941 [Odontomachus brunneus]